MKNFKQKAIATILTAGLFLTLGTTAVAANTSCAGVPAEIVKCICTCSGDLRQIFRYLPKCNPAEAVTPTEEVPVKPTEEVPAEPVNDEPEALPSQNSVTQNYEKTVVDLVNEQRTAYGLSPVVYSAELSEKARIKSRDMSDNQYFSHNSPTYGTPFEMMTALGITYRSAGENIAMGYSSPEAVVAAWMNSEGHRANILNAAYTELGVGYVADGNYWTQWFIG